MRRRGTTTPRGLGACGRVSVVAGAVAVVAVVAGLGGCTGSPESAPTQWWTPVYDSPWPEPTPTPTPSFTPPERPAAMSEVTEAGAEAVARYFLDLYGYVYATGDLEAWRDLSHPECVFCASVVSNVEEQVAAGHRSEGGAVTFGDLTCVRVSDDFFKVTVDIDQDPSIEYDAAGAVVDESAGDPARLTIALVPADSVLQVREVQVDPVEQP